MYRPSYRLETDRDAREPAALLQAVEKAVAREWSPPSASSEVEDSQQSQEGASEARSESNSNTNSNTEPEKEQGASSSSSSGSSARWRRRAQRLSAMEGD